MEEIPLSLHPLCPRVRPCEYGCIHEAEDLFPILSGVFNSTAAGALLEPWLYFPCSKVGKIWFFLFDYLLALLT
jgi:hypothetical protein